VSANRPVLTPEEISRLAMARRAGRAAAGGRAAIPRRSGSGPVPASFAQQRLWLLDRLQPGSAAYNLPVAYRLRGELDRAALARALSELARRHEALRTTFGEEDGQPMQLVAPAEAGDLALAVEDLSALAPGEREPAAGARLAAEAARPFDLARGPLGRALILRLAADEHRLLLCFHHAVFDGWSMGVLWRELDGLYAAFRDGRPSPLAEPPLQYPEFALWQRARLAGPELRRHLDFWRDRLADPPSPLELPTDRGRPGQPSDRGEVVVWTLPAPLVERLRRLARRGSGSLFMALLAGFEALLARLSGQNDLLVGVPHAGRGRAELDDVVGFFINALTVRADLRDEPSFSALFERTRDQLLGATEHQEAPLEKLLEELQPERSLSRAPLFQVLFNMIDLPAGPPRLAGIEVEVAPLAFHPAKFDFTVYAETRGEEVRLDLLYSADLFERPRMAALLDQYQHLLERFAERPDEPVSRSSLVTPAAARVLPDPRAPLAADWRGPIHAALSARAAETPDQPAAVDRWGELSFAELERRANRLAHRLRAAGVGGGDRVAILGHRDASLATAVFGALKAGAAFAVLDPSHPPARLASYLDQLAPRAVVELAAARPLPPEAQAAVAASGALCRLRLPARGSAAEAHFLDGEPAEPPRVPLGPEDPAAVVFTSGSTGVPKGVVGRHGSLTHFLPWMCRRFGLGNADRFSVLSALSHDPLQRELFIPVWLGAPMVFPDPERMGEPGWLAGWGAREGITVAALTPAMLQLLTQVPEAAEDLRLPALRLAFVVGEVLTRAHVARLCGLAPRARCVNLYGATETQRAISFHEADLERPGKEILPLGHGMPGAQLLVVREGGDLAGVGEPGEVWMRSHHLALGYLGDPELTASKFLPNPFLGDAAAPGDRVYRTGDLGRFLPDGGVEFVGRGDGQVKVRGFRIETGEVESVLSRHPGVAECAVAVRDDLPGDRALAAYVVPARSGAAPGRELRAHLLQHLPDYMVPAAYVTLAELPRTSTGKIDRRALPAPASGDLAAEHGRTVPRDEVEELLAGIWRELLGLDEVGVEDDFFALGGHSLLATRLVARIRSAFGRELPLGALFEEPTIAGLARRIERGEGGTALPPVARLSPAARAAEIPLSWGQHRLWFLQRLELTASAAHHIVQALTLTGELDLPALERAVTALAARHEILRTRFVENAEGLACQVIDPPPGTTARLSVEDFAWVPAAEREATLHGWVEDEASAPFALGVEAPIRWRLARFGGVVHRELSALYAAARAEAAAPLPEQPIQYADWAAWQRAWLDGPELDRQLAYWSEHLAGAPPALEVPTDHPRPADWSFRGRRVEATLAPETAARLRAFCREAGATPFMALFAAFGVLLSRLTRAEDLVVGTPIANRRSREVEDLVGLFANILALRLDLSGAPSFRELVRRVRAEALAAYSHQDLPFERLVDALGLERDLSRPPLIQVMLAVQNTPPAELELPGLEVEPVRLPGFKAQIDLFLQAVDLGDGMLMVLEYSAELYEPETARRLLERFARVVEGALAAPEAPVGALPLLSREEERAVLAAGRGPARLAAGPATLHGLVAARAAAAPGRPAVVRDGEALAYGELVAGARRLGRYLVGMGVGAEAPVGVLLERRPALVTALLGVLEAGGCYLPLDPGYPPERLAAMAADAGVVAVVSERSLAALAEALTPPGARRVEIDGADRAGIAGQEPAALERPIGPDHLAYVLYTSGSTGKPKGVEVRHGGAVAFLGAMARRPGVGPEDVVLATTTVSFDISVLELFLPLAVGARVELVDRETAADGRALAPFLDEVTVAQATPTSWRMLLDGGWRGRPGLKALSGGEPLDRELAGRLLAAVGAAGDRSGGGAGELWNVYGPTETTVWSTAGRVAPGAGPVAIGEPIAETRLYVVDRRGELCPVGVPGELWIAGAGVARGYRGRPGATAERFVPEPAPAGPAEESGGRPGGRAYRTGDLVRWRADGALECLGRLDHQVKVRGHRIEPGEIEAALLARPEVARAAVVPFSGGAGGEGGAGTVRLAAYLVLEPGAPEPTVEALRAGLAETLPEYMVPAAFAVVPELPATPNGKVDRKALAALGPGIAARPALGEDYLAPETEAERALAAVWREVLGVERVGARDRFFSLGGDSILALQVVTRAARAGWTLAVRDLFRHPSLRDLAAAARRGGPAVGPGPLPIGEPARGPWSTEFPEAELTEDEVADLLAEISE
jgi:amino acid adenylation domain-containing protein